MEIIKAFTNTDSEDFEGMFHGEKYLILAGESKPFTEKLAKHLSGQLAWKLACRNGLEKFPEEAIKELAKTFVGSVAIPPAPVVVEKVVKVKAVEPEEEFAEIKKPKKAVKKAKK